MNSDNDQPKRGDGLRSVMRQRDEAWAQIERLQCALNFWLPCIPENEPEGSQRFLRIAHDADLLVGYEGPLVDTAEGLGWVKLSRDEQPTCEDHYCNLPLGHEGDHDDTPAFAGSPDSGRG